MSELKTLLQICALCKPTRQSIRKLITLRSKKSYKLCLKFLKSSGIKPFKTVPSSRIIGCHFKNNSTWRALNHHPNVKLVEKDIKIRAHDVINHKSKQFRGRSIPLLIPAASITKITWNIRQIKAPEAWSTTRGGSIKVAIIDTGIASHPDLRISGGVNTINGGSYTDDNGHGTHVAGILSAAGVKGKIIGTAPDVKLYAVKALNQNGEGFVSNIIEGIDWCIKNRMQVINMSLGIIGLESSDTLHDAIRRATKKGIVIVASAGNSGSLYNQLDEPASFKETIAVAASTPSKRIADFSSRGAGITISAPGQNILSTSLNHAYVVLSGTSMASPHVAGGAALLLATQPRLSPSNVKKRLRERAQKLKGASPLAQGAGLIQLDRIFTK